MCNDTEFFYNKNFFKKVLTNIKVSDIIFIVVGELCNGSTTDSDSVCWGSNPYSPASNPRSLCFGGIFLY